MSCIKKEGNCVLSDLTIGGWTRFKRKLKVCLDTAYFAETEKLLLKVL